MSSLELAVKCLQGASPEAGGAHVIMEAGYMLLGALCISLSEDVLAVSISLLKTKSTRIQSAWQELYVTLHASNVL